MTTRENLYYFHTDENCYFFLGTHGSLAFPQLELWRYAAEDQSGWQHPLERSSYSIDHSDPIKSQMEHFCRVVRGEEVPLVDGHDATRSLAVAVAILESAEHQVPILLSLPKSEAT
jgi:predicted dehydrogenase